MSPFRSNGLPLVSDQPDGLVPVATALPIGSVSHAEPVQCARLRFAAVLTNATNGLPLVSDQPDGLVPVATALPIGSVCHAEPVQCARLRFAAVLTNATDRMP